MKKIFYTILGFFILLFFVSCITTYVVYSGNSFTTNPTEYYLSNNDFSWPIPGYTKISSNFGLRISPTAGASKYHSGIDIPAPERHKIICSIVWNNYISWL